MGLEKSSSPKILKSSTEHLISIKKFAGKLSLYFISDTANKPEIKLNSHSCFNCLDKRIDNYEVLLKKYKMQYEKLLNELGDIN